MAGEGFNHDWETKRELKSKHFPTDWNELLIVKVS